MRHGGPMQLVIHWLAAYSRGWLFLTQPMNTYTETLWGMGMGTSRPLLKRYREPVVIGFPKHSAGHVHSVHED